MHTAQQRDWESLLADPAVIRFHFRHALDALTKLSAPDRLALVATPPGPSVRTLLAQVSVLEKFDVMTTDANSGQSEPVAVVWLKTFFAREGAAQALRSSIQAVLPQSLPDFDRVKTVEEHAFEDAAWLASLGGAIAEHRFALMGALLDRSSRAVQVELNGYLASPYHAALAESVASEDAQLAAGERSDIATRYPMPEAIAKTYREFPYFKVASLALAPWCGDPYRAP